MPLSAGAKFVRIAFLTHLTLPAILLHPGAATNGFVPAGYCRWLVVDQSGAYMEVRLLMQFKRADCRSVVG